MARPLPGAASALPMLLFDVDYLTAPTVAITGNGLVTIGGVPHYVEGFARFTSIAQTLGTGLAMVGGGAVGSDAPIVYTKPADFMGAIPWTNSTMVQWTCLFKSPITLAAASGRQIYLWWSNEDGINGPVVTTFSYRDNAVNMVRVTQSFNFVGSALFQQSAVATTTETLVASRLWDGLTKWWNGPATWETDVRSLLYRGVSTAIFESSVATDGNWLGDPTFQPPVRAKTMLFGVGTPATLLRQSMSLLAY